MSSARFDNAAQTVAEPEIYDFLGLGFGPANLALAISLEESEQAKNEQLKFGFLERQMDFAWHPSLLLPGAQLQVSPLKDLATMRDPTSTFTFVNYLHKMGRLAASINRESTTPSRREWSAYLTWCASRMRHRVHYGEEVISIDPIINSGGNQSCIDHALSEATAARLQEHVRLLRITSRERSTGNVRVRLARNISIGVGGQPQIPKQFSQLYPSSPWEQASRVVHSGTFLPSLHAIEPELSAIVEKRLGRSSPASQSNWPLRFAVLGAGQSSAEMALYLRKTFPAASVQMIFRASAIVPSDDSAFVNSAAFDPERTDVFWKAGEQERESWIQEFKRTNYSVVRSDVLNELNDMLYDQKIELRHVYPGSDGPAEGRLDLSCNTAVEKAEMIGSGAEEQIRLTLRPTRLGGTSEEQTYDAVFLGTGFARKPHSIPFLRGLQQHFPILSDRETADQRLVEKGFSPDSDQHTQEGDDPELQERVRERVRGITRDYRLVAYSSDAFLQPDGTRISPAFSRRSSNDSETTLANAEDAPAFEPAIYTFGGNEATHGLSDSLLSICAWRAGEVTESIMKRLYPTPDSAGQLHDGTTDKCCLAIDLQKSFASAASTHPKQDLTAAKARAAAQVAAQAPCSGRTRSVMPA